MLEGFGLWKWWQLTDRVSLTFSFGWRGTNRGRWYFDILPTLCIWRHQLFEQHKPYAPGKANLYGMEMIWMNFALFRIDIELE